MSKCASLQVHLLTELHCPHDSVLSLFTQHAGYYPSAKLPSRTSLAFPKRSPSSSASMSSTPRKSKTFNQGNPKKKKDYSLMQIPASKESCGFFPCLACWLPSPAPPSSQLIPRWNLPPGPLSNWAAGSGEPVWRRWSACWGLMTSLLTGQGTFYMGWLRGG